MTTVHDAEYEAVWCYDVVEQQQMTKHGGALTYGVFEHNTEKGGSLAFTLVHCSFFSTDVLGVYDDTPATTRSFLRYLPTYQPGGGEEGSQRNGVLPTS